MKKKINCTYNDDGFWCKNKDVKRSFLGCGMRHCVEFYGEECKIKEEFVKPKIFPRPRKIETKNKVLAYLEQHGSITPLQAIDNWKMLRLGAVIFDLRKKGHSIETEIVEKNGKRFARYWLRR